MNDKMELEEAIQELESLSPSETAIKTVLQALKEQDEEILKYQLYLTEDVIPKKKIEDKIEELKCEIDELNEKYNKVDKITDDVERCIQKTTFQTLLNVRYRKLDVLQELLEEKN